MQARTFALVLGVVYILFGIIGFIPGLRSAPPAHAPTIHASAGYGYVFGLFPVNDIHNVINIIIGILAILAAGSLGSAIGFERLFFIIFGLLAVAGFMPQANTLGGWVPILDADVWVHAISSILCAYFGWVMVPEETLVPAT